MTMVETQHIILGTNILVAKYPLVIYRFGMSNNILEDNFIISYNYADDMKILLRVDIYIYILLFVLTV